MRCVTARRDTAGKAVYGMLRCVLLGCVLLGCVLAGKAQYVKVCCGHVRPGQARYVELRHGMVRQVRQVGMGQGVVRSGMEGTVRLGRVWRVLVGPGWARVGRHG